MQEEEIAIVKVMGEKVEKRGLRREFILLKNKPMHDPHRNLNNLISDNPQHTYHVGRKS